jgi:hypothetical protein
MKATTNLRDKGQGVWLDNITRNLWRKRFVAPLHRRAVGSLNCCYRCLNNSPMKFADQLFALWRIYRQKRRVVLVTGLKK